MASVYQNLEDGRWYFRTEDERDEIGPYSTKSKAEAGMAVYAADGLGDKLTIDLQKDGDEWCATINGAFLDLQNSFVGFGATKEEAVADLFHNVQVRE